MTAVAMPTPLTLEQLSRKVQQLEAALAQAQARTVPRIWRFFETMPSTNVRIAASILMALGTWMVMVVTAVILKAPWEPTEIWLGFLVIWSGLDVTQFIGKRQTSNDFALAKAGIPPEKPAPAQQPETGA